MGVRAILLERCPTHPSQLRLANVCMQVSVPKTETQSNVDRAVSRGQLHGPDHGNVICISRGYGGGNSNSSTISISLLGGVVIVHHKPKRPTSSCPHLNHKHQTSPMYSFTAHNPREHQRSPRIRTPTSTVKSKSIIQSNAPTV